MRGILFSAVIALCAAPARSAGLEEAAGLARAGFAATLGGFQLPRFKPAAAATAPSPAVTAAPAELARLFDAAEKPKGEDFTGWFAGRRFVGGGAAAQLLVGVELSKDAEAGPIAGVTLRLGTFGGDRPGVIPADIYDNPGSETANAVITLTRERAPSWGEARFGEKGVTFADGEKTHELRKSGSWLILKYADGSYAYFFKKVR